MPEPRSHLRRVVAVAAVLPLAGVLAACGGNSDAKPTFPSNSPALWNPCDALDPALIQKEFGVRTTEKDGTPGAPDCRFVPIARKSAGEAAVNANYQLTPLKLEEYWKSMHPSAKADVRRPKIALADDARVVVDGEKAQLAITGFVQNGDLFQVVNVVDPAPYDLDRDLRGTEALLTALSKHADETGAGESASATATAK